MPLLWRLINFRLFCSDDCRSWPRDEKINNHGCWGKHAHIPDKDYWGICLFHVVRTNRKIFDSTEIILLSRTVMQMICAWPKIWTLSGRLSLMRTVHLMKKMSDASKNIFRKNNCTKKNGSTHWKKSYKKFKVLACLMTYLFVKYKLVTIMCLLYISELNIVVLLFQQPLYWPLLLESIFDLLILKQLTKRWWRCSSI
jgi:hypothetical protein